MSGLTQVWDAIKDRFQTKLVSGTNIKTINGESILTSGNIDAATQDWVNQQGFAKGSFINANGNTLIGDGTWLSLNVTKSNINFKYKDGSTAYLTLGTNGDIKHDNGTGWIGCHTTNFHTIIQGGAINLFNNEEYPIYTEIKHNSILLYQKDFGSTEYLDSYVFIDTLNGIGISGPSGLGIYLMNEHLENVGLANTFWNTAGGQITIESLTESEILEILV